MFFWDLREFYSFCIAKYSIWSQLLSRNINASEYQLRFIACLSAYFCQFRFLILYTYNHLSSLIGAKHGFKPTYNVVHEIRLFTFLGFVFSSKVVENHFLRFYGIWGSKVLNFLVTLNGVLLVCFFHFYELTS